MHRRTARLPTKVVLSVWAAGLGITALAGGCVLRHPPDPATAAGVAWGRTYGAQVVQLDRTAGRFISPAAAPTLGQLLPGAQPSGDALIDTITQSCTDLQTQAQAAQRIPKIPDQKLEVQWASGLRFMVAAARQCLQSLDVTKGSAGLQSNQLRGTATTNAQYGQIRLEAVISFLGIKAPPTTTTTS